METVIINKKQKIFNEYPEMLKKYSDILKSDFDKQLNYYTPEIYKTIDERFNITKKSLNTELKYDFYNIKPTHEFYGGYNRYTIKKTEPNILFNNLKIFIPNPNNLNLNEILSEFIIKNELVECYKLCGDIETHINVLKNFFDASCIYNNATKYIEINTGLLHDKILFAGCEWWDLSFHLKLNPLVNINPTDILFYADIYKIKHVENEMPDTNLNIIFLKTEINTNKIFTDKQEKIFFYNPVSILYLSEINPNIVKSISLIFKNDLIFNFSKEDLINTNKYQYGINSEQIIIIFNPNIIDTNENTINFSRLDCFIKIETFDNMTRSCKVNSINTNLNAINEKNVSWDLYTH